MFSWKTNFTKSKVGDKYKKSCGHSQKLLSVEPNILVVSWRQICDNPLATKVWRQILCKENDIVPPSYLLSFIFSINLVLPLLLYVILSTNTNQNSLVCRPQLFVGSLPFTICSYLANFFLKKKNFRRTWALHDSHRILLVSSVPWLLHSFELPTKYGQDKNIKTSDNFLQFWIIIQNFKWF